MKKTTLSRLTAAVLTLILICTPAAQALTVEQCAELLQKLYVDEVPQSVLEQPTIESMLDALGDPYTEYFTPEEYTAFTASMSDTSLVGIGVVFTITDEGLLIEQVLEGSPALAGGLAEGDLIIAVDGVSILGEDTQTVTGRIQGAEGTTLRVTYTRDGAATTVTLTRATIVIPATTTELIDDHIGYIRCTTFGNETVAHFREGIEAYRDRATVWIVDLRSNLGGVTAAATEAAGLFTGPGDMAYLRDGSDQYSVYRASTESLTLYPVIVLVDQHSASASEIFASAIRDNGAGIVVGTRTFGKGVAQTVLDKVYEPTLFSGGDAIKITSHRFFSPAGNTTDQIGVIPDLLVDPEYTADVAYLLAGADPLTDTTGSLRLNLSWRWYIDTERLEKYPDAFLDLLNAIPTGATLWRGVNTAQRWEEVTPAEVAAQYGLSYVSPTFSDSDDPLSGTAVSILKTYGLVHGYEDGTFRPENTLTRAELCQLLMVALNCGAPTHTSPYTDVPDNAWYAPAVTAMTDLGLVNGVGDGRFQPEEPVEHQQLVTVLGRLAKRLNMGFYNEYDQFSGDASDLSGLADYADWAQPWAWLLADSQTWYFGNTVNMLWDDLSEISPTAATTRSEAAYTLYRILAFVDILSV